MSDTTQPNDVAICLGIDVKSTEKTFSSSSVDITGETFGRWFVNCRAESIPNATTGKLQSAWNCICSCGTERVVLGGNLRRGHSKSCGCLRIENISTSLLKHGQSRVGFETKEYRTWVAMLQRCNLKSSAVYHDYGGRGITVCDRWANSFSEFFADMGKAPTDKHSIDRIDNDSGYFPENCRWATKFEQDRNKRSSKFITYRGQSKLIIDWAKITGLNKNTIYYRLHTGWSIEDALTTPVRSTKNESAL